MKEDKRRAFFELAERMGPPPVSLLAGGLGCPFCKRPILHLMRHHLIPKSLGGRELLDCCRDCHKAIHALLPHKELKRYYHTVDRLLEHEGFRTMVAWIAKQGPTRKVKIERPRNQRGRSKYR